MKYEVVQDKESPDEWNVEAIDFEGEGCIYGATFWGPEAKERADEYAALKSPALVPHEANGLATR